MVLNPFSSVRGKKPAVVDGKTPELTPGQARALLRSLDLSHVVGLRDPISERTKEGLAAAKAKGKRLGRPKGALGTSRLDGKEQDIRALLGKDVSKASIAKILDVLPLRPLPLHPDPQDRSGLTPKARTALMLYFNTNVGATLIAPDPTS